MFHKVKPTHREITNLDPHSHISEAHMKRIIIHSIKPEFISFVIAIQG